MFKDWAQLQQAKNLPNSSQNKAEWTCPGMPRHHQFAWEMSDGHVQVPTCQLIYEIYVNIIYYKVHKTGR